MSLSRLFSRARKFRKFFQILGQKPQKIDPRKRGAREAKIANFQNLPIFGSRLRRAPKSQNFANFCKIFAKLQKPRRGLGKILQNLQKFCIFTTTATVVQKFCNFCKIFAQGLGLLPQTLSKFCPKRDPLSHFDPRQKYPAQVWDPRPWATFQKIARETEISVSRAFFENLTPTTKPLNPVPQARNAKNQRILKNPPCS